MRFISISIIASSVLSSTAMPTSQDPPPTRPDLLSIMSFYRENNFTFTGNDSGWTVSTGTDTWNGFLKNTNGCQQIRVRREDPEPKIPCAMPRWLGKDCVVTLYTDTECRENERPAPLDVCQANEKNWRSWALRNCSLTREVPAPAGLES